jgi:hypothetical protein
MTHRLLHIGQLRIDLANLVLWVVGVASATMLMSAYVDALHASIERGESLRQSQSFDARHLASATPRGQADADAPAP